MKPLESMGVYIDNFIILNLVKEDIWLSLCQFKM